MQGEDFDDLMAFVATIDAGSHFMPASHPHLATPIATHVARDHRRSDRGSV
jgi:hypothetical protein